MIKIGLFGDLIMGERVSIDNEIIRILNSTDFNLCNFEAPFINDSIRKGVKSGLFQKAEDASLLKKLNVKVVSLANNHIGDFEPGGIELTRSILKEEGIASFGAGENLEEASKPAVLDIRGNRVACWGYMLRFFSKRYFADLSKPGIPELKEECISGDIEKIKADIKIVFAHWNQEFEDYPEPVCKELGEDLRGRINLMVGSHPHCLQGRQIFNDYAVYHSLGNFIMPNDQYHNTFLGPYPEKCYHSMFVVMEIDKDGMLQETLYPFVISRDGMRLSLAEKEVREAILKRVEFISQPLLMQHSAYRKYYGRNKIRKLRFTLGRSEGVNYMKMVLYRVLFYSSVYMERILVFLLKKLGIYSIIKEKFARFIAKYQSVR
jgi:poly-gamma-glutamate synthesis protein (capsule biosynthesis protein)